MIFSEDKEMVTCRLLLLTIGAVLLAGCTSQQLYSSAQSWQRNECNRIFDKQERERCMGSTSKTYEEYKVQSGKTDSD